MTKAKKYFESKENTIWRKENALFLTYFRDSMVHVLLFSKGEPGKIGFF